MRLPGFSLATALGAPGTGGASAGPEVATTGRCEASGTTGGAPSSSDLSALSSSAMTCFRTHLGQRPSIRSTGKSAPQTSHFRAAINCPLTLPTRILSQRHRIFVGGGTCARLLTPALSSAEEEREMRWRLARRSSPTCVCEPMKLTGASPSPVEACSDREPDGYCVAARRGGKLPEGHCPAQTIVPTKVNSIRPGRSTSLRRKGEVRVARRAVGLQLPRQGRTDGNDGVVGVSRAGRFHRRSRETGPGARREPGRSQSLHRSCETGNDRGAKGGRKVKA